MTRTAYRAADNSYGGPGACYALEIEDAERYRDAPPDPSFGGATIYAVTLAADADVLSLIRGEEDDWAALAEVVGEDADDLRDGADGVISRAVVEHAALIVAEEYTHCAYFDGVCRGAVVKRLADGADSLEVA